MTSGPRTDLCDLIEWTTVGTFNVVTGGYTFQSFDVPNVPAGDYVFEVTGTIGTYGDVTDSITFTLTMINPCPISSLVLVPISIPSSSTYNLRDTKLRLEWYSTNNLVNNVDTNADCGQL